MQSASTPSATIAESEESPDEPFPDGFEAPEYSEESLLDIADARADVYGFIEAYLEKVANTPMRSPTDPSQTVYESTPYTYDVLRANVMIQGTIRGRYRFFLNLGALNAGDAGVDVSLTIRNAWVEAPLVPQYLHVRAGKTYRRFGLYNEILDAAPTFMGIEPPEMFDGDHLMLTRTTNLMLMGTVPIDQVALRYAVTTGSDERAAGALPLGVDVQVSFAPWFLIGSSFYTTGGPALPTRAVGEGPPKGGVASWMRRDSYFVFGGYAEFADPSGLILQAEYWQARHDGRRDPDALAVLAREGSLHQEQRRRFFGDANLQSPRLRAEYTVHAAYLRAGYDVPLAAAGTLMPYAQFDYYVNPETILDRSLGGDNEAGITDNGRFQKYTGGLVYRPVPEVIWKVDASAHVQRFNRVTEIYPEIRTSLAYLWSL